eukprot:2199801-Rhodomonas_salina.3
MVQDGPSPTERRFCFKWTDRAWRLCGQLRREATAPAPSTPRVRTICLALLLDQEGAMIIEHARALELRVTPHLHTSDGQSCESHHICMRQRCDVPLASNVRASIIRHWDQD